MLFVRPIGTRARLAASLFSRFSSVRDSSNTAAVDQHNRLVRIDLQHGQSLKLPFTWLRDNCQCPKCFNAPIKARRHLLVDFDPFVAAKQVQLTQADGADGDDRRTKLKVHWTDSHTSEYNLRWLKRFSFHDQAVKERRALRDAAQEQHWSVGKLNELGGVPRFGYQSVLTEDEQLKNFLSKLVEFGICILDKVPLEVGHVVKVCERIGFIEETHYGTTFQVVLKPDPSNVTYTNETLGLHTDLPYRAKPPGVQLLHCIEAAVKDTEGLSLFSDGFNGAEELRKANEQHFKLLTEVQVDYKDYSSDAIGRFLMLATHPVIQLDPRTGKFQTINLNQAMRDVSLELDPNQTQKFFEALHHFGQILNSPKNLLKFKIQPGEMVLFNNRRVLHGRTAYQGGRYLESCFLGLDEVKSRLRVLIKQEEKRKRKL